MVAKRICSRSVPSCFGYLSNRCESFAPSSSDHDVVAAYVVIKSPNHVCNERLRLWRPIGVGRCNGFRQLLSTHFRHVTEFFPTNRNKLVINVEFPYLLERLTR